MKQYYKSIIEIIYTVDITTSSPETDFIPFGNTADPISVNYMMPTNEELYEDVP